MLVNAFGDDFWQMEDWFVGRMKVEEMVVEDKENLLI